MQHVGCTLSVVGVVVGGASPSPPSSFGVSPAPIVVVFAQGLTVDVLYGLPLRVDIEVRSSRLVLVRAVVVLVSCTKAMECVHADAVLPLGDIRECLAHIPGSTLYRISLEIAGYRTRTGLCPACRGIRGVLRVLKQMGDVHPYVVCPAFLAVK